MTQLTKEQLQTMMTLQEQMNGRVEKDWRQKGYAWSDAILVEAVEAYDHTYWAWWKNAGKTPDMDQIKLEIIDIWHFVLSELMCHEENEVYTYESLISDIDKIVRTQRPDNFEADMGSIREVLKNVMRAALLPYTDERITAILGSFIVAMDVVGMNWDDLYIGYVCKNTLNQFRQANGYKQDTETYKSIWASENKKEDNHYLAEIAATMDIDPSTFVEDLKNALQTKFDSLKELYDKS
jgi:dimeric dUTPase (all-alpha-NTP-PPase superfamily)